MLQESRVTRPRTDSDSDFCLDDVDPERGTSSVESRQPRVSTKLRALN
jgi:hypothetical protein